MRCAAIALALLLALGIGEAALRVRGFTRPILVQPDPVLGLALTPSQTVWQSREGGTWTVTNSHGWRDLERPEKKSAGTYRIAVLGDSVVQASEVPFDKSLCAQLEAGLQRANARPGSKIEVLCFGVAGFGTAQELLAFRDRVARFEPDFVVLMFYPGNDVSDNWKPFNHPQKLSPYFTLDGDRLVLDDSFLRTKAYQDRSSLFGRAYYGSLRYSRVAQLVHYVRTRGYVRGTNLKLFGPGDPAETYRPPPNRDWFEAWRITEALIRQLHHEVADFGAAFGVSISSTSSQVFADRAQREAAMREHGVEDLFYPDKRIQKLGAEDRFPVLSLAMPMQAVADATGTFLHGAPPDTPPGIGHWNAEGNRIAAELVGKWLIGIWNGDAPHAGSAALNWPLVGRCPTSRSSPCDTVARASLPPAYRTRKANVD